MKVWPLLVYALHRIQFKGISMLVRTCSAQHYLLVSRIDIEHDHLWKDLYSQIWSSLSENPLKENYLDVSFIQYMCGNGSQRAWFSMLRSYFVKVLIKLSSIIVWPRYVAHLFKFRCAIIAHKGGFQILLSGFFPLGGSTPKGKPKKMVKFRT